MEGLSKEDFEKAMARLKEFKEILSQFENRESCVECLAAATGLSPVSYTHLEAFLATLTPRGRSGCD